ncbi:MAG: HlyC/CorC family transporter [Chloroflexi bacterium]|nr:HlyC/CorC family transporter [Chloroflexota bacterium]
MNNPPLDSALAFASQEEAIQLSGVPLEIAIAVLIVSVIAYALVNSIEIAIVSVNRIRVRHLVEQGSRAAKAIERLQSEKARFFAFIVLLQNLFVILSSAMGSIIAADVVGGVGGLVVGIVVLTLGVALLGEVTPKILAAHAGERYPLLVAGPVELLMLAVRPLVTVVAAAPRFLSRLLFGSAEGVTPTVTEAELRMLIDIAAEERAVGEEEAELLESVFHFGDRRVNEVMVHRTEVIWLERGTRMGDFYKVYAEKPHSRFPVFEQSVDNVVGIVGIKDVLRGLAQGELDENSPVDWAMRPALFVPETKPVGALFAEMQRTGHQMAVVVDEFGGTAGVATLEMLLEELVGYVSDELRRHEEEFVSVDERTLQMDASMSIHDANEELQLELPEGDYETVAGFVLEQLGHIPKEGEQFVYNGLRFAVTQVVGRKIEQVTVTRIAGEAPEQRAEQAQA